MTDRTIIITATISTKDQTEVVTALEALSRTATGLALDGDCTGNDQHRWIR